jgi:hypothetical protein
MTRSLWVQRDATGRAIRPTKSPRRPAMSDPVAIARVKAAINAYSIAVADLLELSPFRQGWIQQTAERRVRAAWHELVVSHQEAGLELPAPSALV